MKGGNLISALQPREAEFRFNEAALHEGRKCGALSNQWLTLLASFNEAALHEGRK